MATTEGGMFFTSASQFDNKSTNLTIKVGNGYHNNWIFLLYCRGFTRRFLTKYRMKLSDAKV